MSTSKAQTLARKAARAASRDASPEERAFSHAITLAWLAASEGAGSATLLVPEDIDSDLFLELLRAQGFKTKYDNNIATIVWLEGAPVFEGFPSYYPYPISV